MSYGHQLALFGGCDRCGRALNPWPLGHRGCAPKDWYYCIRTAS